MIFSKIHELIYFQQERYPSKNAFNHKILGRWEARSTVHFIEQMNQLSAGFLEMNMEVGDRVGLYCSYGSPEWLTIDLALMQVGLISVPINPNYTDEEIRYILEEAELSYCFVNEDLLANRLISVGFTKSKIISFGNSIRHKSWSDLRKVVSEKEKQAISKRECGIKDTDLATIIYTSGSTGLPKGVMLSHRNIISNIKSIITLIPVNYHHKVASFLPLSHIFERMVLYTYMSIGAKIYFIDDPKKLVKYMQEIKPDFVSSVPRILERVYSEINNKVKKSNPLVKWMVKKALKAGSRKVGTKPSFMNIISVKLADVFVYRRWRKVLGGRLKGIIVGAASMQEHISRLYTRAGIPVKEGYGLTETSPVVSFNRFEPGGSKYGTVGIPIPGVQVKIDTPDENGAGEILVKGPNVMMGYYKNQELTDQKIDADNWFHTGDVGKFTDGRFLEITDRIKNIFKTSSGQYVYPQKIEAILRKYPAVDQVMIVGFQRAYIVALVVPDFVYLKAWCKDQGIHWTADLYMVVNDRVLYYYQEILDEVNKSLKNFEKIKNFNVLPVEWTLDSGEYTPTLKLRRAKIMEKYGKEIEKMYNGKS